MEKQYEYEDTVIVMRSPTVGSAYARHNILRKLRLAMGYQPGDIVPEELTSGMYEFAEICSRTEASGAAWWVHQLDTVERVGAAWDAFLALEVEFIELARKEANAAVPEKKTTQSN